MVALSEASTMSESSGISACRTAGPLMAEITGTSMLSRFISRCLPSQYQSWSHSSAVTGLRGLWWPPAPLGCTAGPEYSWPVPVRMITSLPRSRPTSRNAHSRSSWARLLQRSESPLVWNCISRMPFSRRMRTEEYLSQ
jgi:hypothetical protein